MVALHQHHSEPFRLCHANPDEICSSTQDCANRYIYSVCVYLHTQTHPRMSACTHTHRKKERRERERKHQKSQRCRDRHWQSRWRQQSLRLSGSSRTRPPRLLPKWWSRFLYMYLSCVCLSMCVCVCVCVCVCIHTYTCTYT